MPPPMSPPPMSAPPASPPAFTPARPEDQSFVPARPQDQGFVPARPEDAATEQPKHWYDTAVKEVGDVASGFKTALNQTGETGMKIVGATGIPQRINPEGWEQSRQQTHDIAHAPLDTGGKMAGAAIENIIEFERVVQRGTRAEEQPHHDADAGERGTSADRRNDASRSARSQRRTSRCNRLYRSRRRSRS